MDKDQIDLLKKAEEVTAELNKLFHKKGRPIFSRYPVLFALLVIFGATLVSQGIKELIFEVPFFNGHPFIMFTFGILILIITGTLFKKLGN
jgi:hypothetical protein